MDGWRWEEVMVGKGEGRSLLSWSHSYCRCIELEFRLEKEVKDGKD